MRAFTLCPDHREVFLLCDLQGFTVGEAAFILGITRDVATARLERARRELDTAQA